MPVPPSNPQGTHAVIAVLIVLGICLGVRYWGTALRIILVIVIGVAVYGAIVGFEGLRSLIAHL
jgi:hypothetical protein